MTMLVEAPALLGRQEPRISCWPDYVSSAAEEAIELVAMAGLHLDESQELVLRHSLGERRDGKWAPFEVGVCEPRQNGKGAILEARELTGIFLLEERLIIHSAHEFPTSLEAFNRLLNRIEATPEFDREVLKVKRSHGEEGIDFRRSRRIRFRTRTAGGGRGFSGDLLILDEAMILPSAMLAALLPTLSAMPNPQVWYAGSAVDKMIHEHGLVFARVRDRGIRGDDPSLAYFEWSVGDPEPELEKPWEPSRVTDELAADADAWAEANPGLGIRISAEHIARELAAMDLRSFAVERLCVGDWPAVDGSGESPITVEAWDERAEARSKVLDPVCLAYDVTPDRGASSVSIAGLRADGRTHVELVERRRGTGWVVDYVCEFIAKHQPIAVVCDGASPAASLVSKFEARGVDVRVVTAPEHAQACGQFFDHVEQDTMRHLGQPELRTAIKGAAKRILGEAWAWSRRHSRVDISPLVSVTLAAWGSATLRPVKTYGSGSFS